MYEYFYSLLVVYRVPELFSFSIQIFKNAKKIFWFLYDKNWLSRVSGYYIYLYIQPFYYRRTAIGVLY